AQLAQPIPATGRLWLSCHDALPSRQQIPDANGHRSILKAVVHHAARRGGGGMAVCRNCAVDDAANPSDDSELAADPGCAREAYRPGRPKVSVSIKRWLG